MQFSGSSHHKINPRQSSIVLLDCLVCHPAEEAAWVKVGRKPAKFSLDSCRFFCPPKEEIRENFIFSAILLINFAEIAYKELSPH